jgi:hypothetical protein
MAAHHLFFKYPMRELIYSKQFDYENSLKNGICLHVANEVSSRMHVAISRFVNFISDDV